MVVQISGGTLSAFRQNEISKYLSSNQVSNVTYFAWLLDRCIRLSVTMRHTKHMSLIRPIYI